MWFLCSKANEGGQVSVINSYPILEDATRAQAWQGLSDWCTYHLYTVGEIQTAFDRALVTLSPYTDEAFTELCLLFDRQAADNPWKHNCRLNPAWKPKLKLREYQCKDCGHIIKTTTNHTGECYPTCQGKCRQIINPHTAREIMLPKQTTHIYVKDVDS